MFRVLSFRRRSTMVKGGGSATFESPTNRIFVYNSELPAGHSNKKRALLLIDPQNDFIAEWGSLKVPGAIDDSTRVANAIIENAKSISQIFVTLDTHQRMHIAHPLFWVGADGTSHPKHFTQITLADIQSGKWVTSIEAFRKWSEQYVGELERQKKFNLIIWPEHCLVGSKGHAVYETLTNALHEWEESNSAAVAFLLKGMNALTEHYSAFKAEVARQEDPQTMLNVRFITTLDSYDEIIIAGQALSHCVNYSVRDLVANLSSSSKSKIIIISDGCSPIQGFEQAAKEFRMEMEKEGIRFLTCKEIFST
jgi:nicotinamidase/pyrazinamidase